MKPPSRPALHPAILFVSRNMRCIPNIKTKEGRVSSPPLAPQQATPQLPSKGICKAGFTATRPPCRTIHPFHVRNTPCRQGNPHPALLTRGANLVPRNPLGRFSACCHAACKDRHAACQVFRASRFILTIKAMVEKKYARKRHLEAGMAFNDTVVFTSMPCASGTSNPEVKCIDSSRQKDPWHSRAPPAVACGQT